MVKLRRLFKVILRPLEPLELGLNSSRRQLRKISNVLIFTHGRLDKFPCKSENGTYLAFRLASNHYERLEIYFVTLWMQADPTGHFAKEFDFVIRQCIGSLLYPCFKTALCYGVVSGCFVHGVSSSSPLRPELAPKRGPGGPGLAFRTPESARKVHAKSSGP